MIFYKPPFHRRADCSIVRNRGGVKLDRLQKPENGAGEAMQPPKIGFSKKKSTILPTKYSAFLVENSGIEPLTSCMPCKRSPS